MYRYFALEHDIKGEPLVGSHIIRTMWSAIIIIIEYKQMAADSIVELGHLYMNFFATLP